MKTRFTIVILWLLVVANMVNAQIDTTRKEFFPLHLGDIWQYRDEFGTISGTFKVIKADTLLPNGYHYVDRGGFFRIDSLLRVQSYSGRGGDSCGGSTPNDISTYRLSEPVGSTWRDCLNFGGYLTPKAIVRYNGPRQLLAFGQLRDALHFRFGGVFPPPIDTSYGSSGYLVKGIGLFRQEYFERNNGFDQLTGAVINGVTFGTIVAVEEIPETYPQDFRLSQNFPNPFNPSTTIRYDLPEPAKVLLIIYDVLGRKVTELVNEEKPAGHHSATWNAADVASGVYLARFTASDANGHLKYSRVNKLVLMK